MVSLYSRIKEFISTRLPRNHRKAMISDGYFAYTTKFDREYRKSDLKSLKLYARKDAVADERRDQIIYVENFKRQIGILRAQLISCLSTNSPVSLNSIGNSPDRKALTILVDHSGSMRGKNIENAALFCALLAPVALAEGFTVEIAGFTTLTWNGGASRRLWTWHGRPKFPGRLCDLLHVIHRPSDSAEGWDDEDVMGMFAPGLLKENVDGEALMWAERRLLESAATRRHLLILSDGAPVDDSTLEANQLADGTYPILYDHAKAQVRRIRSEGKISLSAIVLGDEEWTTYGSGPRIQGLDDIVPKVLIALWIELGLNPNRTRASGGEHET